jgi:hypothetical protein
LPLSHNNTTRVQTGVGIFLLQIDLRLIQELMSVPELILCAVIESKLIQLRQEAILSGPINSEIDSYSSSRSP